MTFGIDLGELGAKQENLRGIIDPHQYHDEGPGRSVARLHAAFADIQPDYEFAKREQQRSDQRSNPHIAPTDRNAWQETVDQRKQDCDDSYRHYEIDDMQQHFHAFEPA